MQKKLLVGTGHRRQCRHENLLARAGRGATVCGILALALATPATLIAAPNASARAQDALALIFTSAANQTAALSVAGEGARQIVVNDDDGVVALVLNLTGRGAAHEIDLRVTAERDATLTLRYESGESMTLALTRQPNGAEVAMHVEDDGSLTVIVTDPSAERIGVSVALTGLESSSGLSVAYDELPAESDEQPRVTPHFPGFQNEEAVGGSVTLSALGMGPAGVAVVSLHYPESDAANLEESRLRVHRFENSAGAFVAAGTNNRGLGAASERLGDFGVDPDNNTAWCVVDRLGTFAVGVPAATLPATVEEDGEGNGLGGSSRGPCGVLGSLGILPIVLGLAVIRPRHRPAA